MDDATFYNEQLKQLFLDDSNYTPSTVRQYESVFRLTAPIEKKYGKDLCQMSPDELQVAFDHIITSPKFRVNAAKKSNILPYLKWCIAVGVSGATKNFMKVDMTPKKSFKDAFVASPESLQELLDKLLRPEMQETLHNLVRAYFWMAFGGVPHEKLITIKPKDIDFQYGIVTCDGEEYPLYRQGFRAVHYLCTLKAFRRYSGRGFTVAERAPGDEIFRTYVPVSSMHSNYLSEYVSARIVKPYEKMGGSSVGNRALTYTNIELSGLFYRVYQFEQVEGEGAFDFYEHTMSVIKKRRPISTKPEDMSWKQFYAGLYASIDQSERDLRYNYDMWKKAFHP